MKVLEINSLNFGSTGGIMLQIADNLEEHGENAIVCCAKSRENMINQQNNQILIGNRISRNLHRCLAKITGLSGCFSVISTYLFLQKVNQYNPDIIHLHNLHSDYINIPLLFRYIKKRKIPVVWTLHDCWSFTGHCPYFTLEKCSKYREGCHSCKIYRTYPESLFDNSTLMWRKKKKWFSSVQNMTIVTPSQWLADTVKHSFLYEYPVRLIYNGIDLSIFRPRESEFRKNFSIPIERKIVLGVAFGWGRRKGLDVFLKLAQEMDGEKYQIVLVGTSKEIDSILPDNIISIHRTSDSIELAQIYSAADVFVNPTREEVLGLVNIEANACGTPVVTFKTGGSPECIDSLSGRVVECEDIAEMERQIELVCERGTILSSDCIKRAKKFEKNKKYDEYYDLYKEIMRAKDNAR